MDSKQKAFIQECIAQEKTRAEIRAQLISHGHGTAGFEEIYAELLEEMGKTEPAPVPTNKQFVSHNTQSQPARKRAPIAFAGKWKSVLSFLLVLALCAVIFLTLSRMGLLPNLSISDISISDQFTRSKVDATAASAHVFGNRMGSFEGACDDITVVAPLICHETNFSYAVYAPLSDGTLYCVDSTGFSGIAADPPLGTCE